MMKSKKVKTPYGFYKWVDSDGVYHREDGPAVEWEDGSKLWYTKGIRHRENGPAAEWGDGIKEFYLNGKELTEKEFILKRLIKRISKLK